MSDHFICAICGQTHEGLPTDCGFALPDDVWAVPEQEREKAAWFTNDLCEFGGRYFIRCILRVPFSDRAGEFGWGAWVEVDFPIFERYIEIYHDDGAAEPPCPGTLANRLPTYDASSGLPVLIRFGDRAQRPSVHLAPDDCSALAREQRDGIDSARYHGILEALSPRR